jgi:hypothetical protein
VTAALVDGRSSVENVAAGDSMTIRAPSASRTTSLPPDERLERWSTMISDMASPTLRGFEVVMVSRQA